MSAPLGQALGRVRGWLTARRSYPIGLHMGMHRLNLVQMRPSAVGPPAIRAAAALEDGHALEELLASPKLLKRFLHGAFAGQPFKGRRVVSCMPVNQVKIQQLNYTAAAGESDTQAIVRELRGRTQMNLDGVVVDYLPVRADDFPGGEREAIVATAARDKLTAYLDSLSQTGLEVDALDIGPLALMRVARWIGQPEKESPPNLLLINFGARASYLTVVWGRRLMLDRGIHFAERHLIAALEKQLDVSEDDARHMLVAHGVAPNADNEEANEISRTLREVLRLEFAALTAEVSKTLVYTASTTHGHTVDKICLLGAVARYPGIAELLREELSIPIEVLDPFSIFPHRLKAQHLARLRSHSGITVAAGLALRDLEQAWPNSI